MKPIDRIDNERLGHVVWPLDVSATLTNIINLALEGLHSRAEYRTLDPLHEEWLAKVFSADIGEVLSSTLDDIGRARLPTELQEATTHYIQQMTPPAVETQDYGSYLKRLLLGLESHPTGQKDKEKRQRAVPLGPDFIEPVELWDPSVGYPRCVARFKTLPWVKDLSLSYRLPHPRSTWCQRFALALLKLDSGRMDMSLISAVTGEVAKMNLQSTDRPMSDAKRLSIQLHAVISMYALYCIQGTLLIAGVHDAQHELLYTQATHYYAMSRGRLSKWQQARERLKAWPVHPIVAAVVSMYRTTTTTQIGKRDFIPTLVHPDTIIDKMKNPYDLLYEFIDDSSTNKLLRDTNKWTLDATRKQDAIDKLLVNIQDADVALLDSRCSFLFDAIAAKLNWSKASFKTPDLQLDRRQWILSDGDSFSTDPIAAVAGLLPVLPISNVKAIEMSGFAENFFDTDYSEGLPQPRPRAIAGFAAKTPKMGSGEEITSMCELAISTVTAKYQVESTWSTLRHEQTHVPGCMLMGQDNVIAVNADPTYITDPEAAEIYLHYVRRAAAWAERDSVWEKMRRFVEPVPTPKSKIIVNGDDKEIGYLWGTSWEPQGSLAVSTEEAAQLMDYQLPADVTLDDPGKNLPQKLALYLPDFMNGEATKKLKLYVRTDGSDFSLRFPVIKALAQVYIVFSDDMKRARSYLPWVSVVYDNDLQLPSSNSTVSTLPSLIYVVRPKK